MTTNDRPMNLTPDQLNEVFSDLALTSRPDYRDDLLRRTAQTRQRPAWTFLERWLPMTLLTARQSTAPPLRMAWTLLLMAAVTAALIAGLAIAGSTLLRDPNGPSDVKGLVPVLERDDSWAGLDLGLSVPNGLDTGPDGNVYLVNAGSNEIVVLDPTGVELRRWGSAGSGDGEFLFQRDPRDLIDSVGGVAVAGDGTVYVTDTANDRIQHLTPEGEFLDSWGGHGARDGRFLEPIDVAIGPDGSVFVVDDLRDDIQRFTPDGEWLQTIGRHGRADGEMDFTGGIAVDEAGVLLNADFGNGRVQAWDGDGAFLWSKGGDRSSLVNPGDVDAAAADWILVSDERSIKVFGDAREPVSTIDLGIQAASLAVAGDYVYVSSPSEDRIVRLRIAQQEATDVETAAASEIPSSAPVSASPPATPASPAAGGAETLLTDTIFEVPFSAGLPTTLPAPGGHPGWWRQDLMPGLVSFQYVRDADRTPAYVSLYLVEGVYSDPCHPEQGLATADEPTVDELVEALTHQVGVRATAPTEIVLGEHRGLAFDLANSIDTRSCADTTWLPQWTYHRDGLDVEELTDSGGLPNSHQRVAIVDVDGVPVLIESWEVGANREEVLQADALFESIRFE